MRIFALISFAAVICFSGSADADFVDIQVVSTDGTVTGARLAQFDAAAAIWEGILNEYSVDVPDGTFVSIDASISFIDGPGGTLGQAGPDSGFVEGSFLYTATGFMEFDSADVPTLDGNGTFDAVILHEMAHVMGFGTLWNTSISVFLEPRMVYINGSGSSPVRMALACFGKRNLDRLAIHSSLLSWEVAWVRPMAIGMKSMAGQGQLASRFNPVFRTPVETFAMN